MNLLILKKVSFAVILLAFCFLNSMCRKKIEKYPFDMAGIWYAPKSFACGGFVLEIEKNSEGRLFGYNNSYCSLTKLDLEGKIKFKRDIFYVKNRKYEIVEEPVFVTELDSVDAPNENDYSSEVTSKRKILAKMTLREKGFFASEEKHTFYKYLNF